MTYDDIISGFQPTLLDISDIDPLVSAIKGTNFLIYGEIHGIQENASVIYSLVKLLNIERIAIENSPTVKSFIDAASQGVYNTSLIDTDTFDLSILSLEVAKTIAVLVQEGSLRQIDYIDTFFDSYDPNDANDPSSPQKREQDLANNMRALGGNMRTLCLMGQWHTQPAPVPLINEAGVEVGTHLSALHQLRKANPQLPFVHVIYRKGQLFNDGRIIDLPMNASVSSTYKVVQISEVDFDLHVPVAHKISLPALVS